MSRLITSGWRGNGKGFWRKRCLKDRFFRVVVRVAYHILNTATPGAQRYPVQPLRRAYYVPTTVLPILQMPVAG